MLEQDLRKQLKGLVATANKLSTTDASRVGRWLLDFDELLDSIKGHYFLLGLLVGAMVGYTIGLSIWF